MTTDVTVVPVTDISTGELSRGLGRLEKTIENGFRSVNDRIDGIENRYVSKELYRAELDSIWKAIGDGLNSRRWVLATAISAVAVVTAVLSLVLHVQH